MKIKEALDVISDGHSIISPEKAREVCKALGIRFDAEKLVHYWKSDRNGDPKGLTMRPEFENTAGVYTLTLSAFVATRLGVYDKAPALHGRGSQARAYAQEVAKKLEARVDGVRK